jgi:hypothetical protein
MWQGTEAEMGCAMGDGRGGTRSGPRRGRVGRAALPCGAEWEEERGATRDESGCGVAALEKATARSLALEKGAALSFFFFWRSGLTSGVGHDRIREAECSPVHPFVRTSCREHYRF